MVDLFLKNYTTGFEWIIVHFTKLDPDPLSLKRLDPDPYKANADTKHCR
jgi:hypothetical protein